MKKVFQEARGGTEDFEGLMTAYYRAINSGKGALFLGVCRGKVRRSIKQIRHISTGFRGDQFH